MDHSDRNALLHADRVVASLPQVLHDTERGIGTEDKACAEESEQQHEAVVELKFGTSPAELVHEPVHIEEGGR